MILNDNEQAIWDSHKDFFAPQGVASEAAYNAYLGKYALIDSNQTTGVAQQQLLGVLLKHAPDNAFSTAFLQYYSQFRTGPNSTEFDTWLGEVAAQRPALLPQCLKDAAPPLNFTQQVMVLRDVQKWFPGSHIKDYAPQKLLKTKSSVILKQFNPTLVDMPYLLAMSASLMNDGDPQSQALGDTIVRGSFIARYGMPPESDEGRYANPYDRPTVKYCTTDAFAMLLRHGIEMESRTLLQQVQLRYNAATVMFDALAYPLMVLGDAAASAQSRTYALDVFNEVLTYAEANPDHPGFGPTVEAALASMHSLLQADHGPLALRIEDVMEVHMRTATGHGRSSARTFDSALSTIASAKDSDSTLLHLLAKRVVQASPEPMQFLLHHTADVGMNIYNAGRCELRVRNAFFALLPPVQMDEYLAKGLRAFFDDSKPSEERTQRLSRLLESFAEFTWNDEQTKAFKQSPLAPTVILLYLYMAAAGHSKTPESTQQYGLPYTQWKPLPFLKKMYPENQALWNQMTIGLLQMPMGSTEADAKLQYQHVMGSMYQAFSQAFLADGPSLAITQGIIESLGANPLDYFMDAHKKSGPIMALDLPQDMFSFE